MALADILVAISSHADQRIAEARTVHQKHLTQLREASERAIAGKKQSIAQQKEQRKNQLKAKAENHAAMVKRNALLRKKRELLDSTYAAVTEKLSALPPNTVEPLLRACLKSIRGKGIIHPARKHADLLKRLADSAQFSMGEPIDAAGGFLFSSLKQEQDCTFEHLISEVLRPQTELEVSRSLFTAA
ncbi:hypothetical protein COU80_05145 [Candidatus Peregrinibacteria bacterium CG10_big_fil_rev_8_21_14_0_10_55_24]|nr:MAG: hypothetical protein COU80_05145 [Candidatus Peregrinibacteria bacterium CG10_big_fil_rev_8_21_14_0_10_55_24]